jgi:hypothetical protein
MDLLGNAILGWACLYILCWLIPLSIKSERFRKICLWGFPVAAMALLVIQRNSPPVWRLASASLFLLYMFKGSILLSQSRASNRKLFHVGYLVFMSV